MDELDLIRESLGDAIDYRRSRAASCPGDCLCRGKRCDECWEDQQLAEDYETLLDTLDAYAAEHQDDDPPRPETTLRIVPGIL